MTEADFEDCSLWPIVVDFGQGGAYSLWGSAGGEDDLVLAVGDRLRAFVRWPKLVDWVVEGHACNLSDLDGYEKFRRILTLPGRRVPDAPKRYPFGEVSGWLSDGEAVWNEVMCSTTLDCLNLLWDAARTIGATSVQDQLRRGAQPLGPLMDALTFADETHRRELAAQPWPKIAATYASLLGEMTARWDIE